MKKIKKGDLVYYITGYDNKRYCIVNIVNNNEVWGKWEDTIEEAKNSQSNTDTWIKIDRIFLCKTNWKERLQ